MAFGVEAFCVILTLSIAEGEGFRRNRPAITHWIFQALPFQPRLLRGCPMFATASSSLTWGFPPRDYRGIPKPEPPSLTFKKMRHIDRSCLQPHREQRSGE